MLETEIIDTGIGISEERQKMLFIPFLELKLKQNLKQVQDNNIGMGLACSEAISAALQGDITIK
jgi:signal transduction histidine kinase